MLTMKRFFLAAAQDKPAVTYDAELAKSLGANDLGMRN